MITQQVLEVLKTLKEYNKRLQDGIEQAVDYLRIQEEGKAVDLLIQVIDGLKWTFEVVFITKNVFEENGIEIDMENINSLLKELLEALENKDYVLISDLLEYEILEFLGMLDSELENMNLDN